MTRTKPLALAFGLVLSAACALAAAPAGADGTDSMTDDAVTGASAAAPKATAPGTAMPMGAAAPTGLSPVAMAADASPTAAAMASPTPTPAPKAPRQNLPTDFDNLRDQFVKLEDAYDDQQSAIRQLQAALNDVRSVAESRSPAQPTEGGSELRSEMSQSSDHDYNPSASHEAEPVTFVWRRLRLYVNQDTEFTSEYNTDPASKHGDLGVGNTPDYVQAAAPNGALGFFFKHTDLHLGYKFDEHMYAKFDYNLSALEVDCMGLGWKNLPFPPLTSGWGSLTYGIFIGQRRQSFGIEQQTDSENLMFPNRALMYGGHNAFGNAVTPGNDSFELLDQATTIGGGGQANSAASNNLIAELAYEKVMGVHLYSNGEFGWLAYTLGFDLVNDESERSVDGGGTDSLKSGFPLQTEDQDMSEIGRLGLEPHFLNRALPLGMKFKFGGSAFHDPENTQYYASQAQNEYWADCYGADGTLETARDIVYVQSEYARREQFGPAYVGSGSNWNVANYYGGLQGAAESYYVAVSLQPWRIFDPKAPRVELLGRYESYYYEDLPQWMQSALGPYTGTYNATTVALKYTYMGNCHTSVNYTTFGLNNDFNAMGPTEYLQFEQQMNF